jgi:acyl carrier protein
MPEVDLETLKKLLVENCMLKTNVDLIDENTPLFGPNSVGLDSLDALQLTVAIEKKFGIVLDDPETVRRILQNLGTLRTWLAENP